MTDREHGAGGRTGDDPGFDFATGLTASEAEFAADLAAVRDDDALLDVLGGSDPRVADDLGDPELNDLLLAWRRDIDSEPLAELVDPDTALTTVCTAGLARKRGLRDRRRRLLVPVAAAAAVLAIAFTGTALVARGAQPGDTLWGLSKVLYSDHARSVEAAATARVDLERAHLALAGGRLDEARQALDDAQAALKQVSADDGNLDQLMEQHRQLSAQLDNPTPSSQLPTSVPPLPGSSQSTASPPQESAAPDPKPTTSSGSSLPETSAPPPPPSSDTSAPPPTSTTPTPTDTGTESGISPRNDPNVGGDPVPPAGG